MTISNQAQLAIQEEIDALNRVISGLLDQRHQRLQRLHAESSRSRDLTAHLVSLRNDEDKQLLASDESVSHSLREYSQRDLKTIDKLLKNPYFARVVVEENVPSGTKRIEYKIGFYSNPDCSIIDWRRGPLAKLYYDYQEGEEYCEIIQDRERCGKILIRNKVEIKNQDLLRFSCKHGTFIKENNEWKELKGGFLSRGLESGSELPSILALITAEQFKLITEDASSAILIDGIAGSGKTTVALHRLAWLMDSTNKGHQASRCLILVHSKIIKAYIENLLPSMGIENPPIKTLAEWTEERVKEHVFNASVGYKIQRTKVEADLGIKRVKSSLAMLKAVDDYVKSQNQRLLRLLNETINSNLVTSNVSQLLDSFVSGKLAAIPCVEELIDYFKNTKNPGVTDEENDRIILSLTSTLKRLNLYHKDIIAILANPGNLLVHDETNLLDRDLINRAHEETIQAEANGELDDLDDSIMLHLCQLKRGAITPKSWGIEKYQHIVVDEVQDYSALELEVVINSVKTISDLTLVGDVEQQNRGDFFPGWNKLQSYWSQNNQQSRYVKLTVSHRSTLPIMRLAEYVSTERRATSGRKGKRPLWIKCIDENDGVKQILRWLERTLERYPRTLIAIICENIQEAKYATSLLEPTFGSVVRLFSNDTFSFEEGIVVTSASEVKGLEFPVVAIWNPNKRAYPDTKQSRNLLYIAITRAQEMVAIFSWDRPSKLLPHIHSKLIYGIDRTELIDESEG